MNAEMEVQNFGVWPHGRYLRGDMRTLFFDPCDLVTAAWHVITVFDAHSNLEQHLTKRLYAIAVDDR